MRKSPRRSAKRSARRSAKRSAKRSAHRRSPHRLSDYQKFVKAHMHSGTTMKDVAKMWKRHH